MRTNPAGKWHHISVRDPARWKIVSTKQFGKSTGGDGRSDNGIQARLGREHGKGPTRPVTLLFDPRLRTIDEAVAWAKEHGEEVREVLEAPKKPGHSLSKRAGQLREGRTASKGIREVLQKHGIGVRLTRGEAVAMPDLVRVLVPGSTADLLSCGFFHTPGYPEARGSSAVVALPPDKTLLRIMRRDLAVFEEPLARRLVSAISAVEAKLRSS